MIPLRPCSITSGTAPQRDAITGVPHAIDSTITSPNGSSQSIGNSVARASTPPGSLASSVAQDAAAGGLRERLDHQLVDVHVRRAGQREEDAVGDVVRGHRLDAAVDGGGLLRVAAEADTGEVGLDQA